jgi:DNA-binding transcriptional ArsR family regulator
MRFSRSRARHTHVGDAARATEEAVEDPGGFGLPAGRDVLGHVEGEAGAGVAEALADLHGDVGLEQQGGVGVAQVVEADAGEAVLGDEAVDGPGDLLGVDRLAIGPGEHEALRAEVLTVVSRSLLVMDVLAAGVPVVEVAERYGMSRKTVHSWLNRYRDGGLAALAERSHRCLRASRRGSKVLRSQPCWMM